MRAISNFKKFFSYNWTTTFKELAPNGSKKVMDQESVKDITSGSIIRIIGAIVAQIAIIGLAFYIVYSTAARFGLSGIMSASLSSYIADNAGEYAVNIIQAAIVPIVALVFVLIMKQKQQTSWPYLILMIIALAQTIYSLYGVIGWLAAIIASPIFALIGLATVFIAVTGNISIMVGCIDFCKSLAIASPVTNIQQPITNVTQPIQQFNQPQQPAMPITATPTVIAQPQAPTPIATVPAPIQNQPTTPPNPAPDQNITNQL